MKPGKDLVKAVGDVRKHRPLFSGKAPENEVQNIVRAVGHEKLLRGQAVKPCQLLFQSPAVRVWVEPQIRHVPGCEKLPDSRGRGVGVFVGVQLDIVPVLGLFSRGVGVKPG